MTILDLARRDPEATALDDLTRRRTRRALIDRACRIANMLRRRFGLAAGDHVAMVMGNRVEFVELCLGSLLAGVWMTPVNWHLASDEVAYILDDSGARLLIGDPAHEELARSAAGRRPVVLAGPELDSLLDSSPSDPPDLSGPPGGNMIYTSGTTGRPKGVIRAPKSTVGESLAALPAAGRVLGLDGAGPHLVTGPLYHAAPLGFAVMDQHGGAEIVIQPRFDAEQTVRLIDERRIRNTHLVPTMFVRLLRIPPADRPGYDLSSLHTVLHGAAPITAGVKRQMIDWWGPVLTEYWGASEGGVVTLARSAEWLERPGTVGRAIAHHEVWAGDDEGRPLPSGSEGLLWCRNRTVDEVFEYHGAPEKTRAAFAGPGVYTLGDVGRVADDGFVYLTDRKSNMIISGGVNIYPAEVENVLHEHPAVADVAVFGTPDGEWGESVRAAVELAEGWAWSEDLEQQLLAHGREHLAGYKVPRAIDCHDRLPRHDTGKLLKRQLRDPYWQDRDGRI